MLVNLKKYIVIGSLFFVLSACGSKADSITYTSISIDEMYQIIDDGVIIDVRTSEEYESYNIEGSINIALDEIDSITQIITEKNTQIFVYCASGVRSNQAAETLVDLGYTNVYDMGGIYS